ncbi:hypothetical protein bsdtb5_32570 [Anaeromicropila herbilytica]|uniref:Uncharacterized protein n=2 Tax=Anaeromicropila herbilytica TaxID=2785025 RepID=A0A7R7ENB7_9FIRM|nr:hypothetical protein bsdtb5_32570 [Anaeromicropila herbilytica]
MAFGFEYQQPKREWIPKKENFVETSVIASFKEDGDLKPLKLLMEQEGERTVYDIPKIYYKSICKVGKIESIRFGIRLDSELNIMSELVYFIEEHNWKIKLLS